MTRPLGDHGLCCDCYDMTELKAWVSNELGTNWLCKSCIARRKREGTFIV